MSWGKVSALHCGEALLAGGCVKLLDDMVDLRSGRGFQAGTILKAVAGSHAAHPTLAARGSVDRTTLIDLLEFGCGFVVEDERGHEVARTEPDHADN